MEGIEEKLSERVSELSATPSGKDGALGRTPRSGLQTPTSSRKAKGTPTVRGDSHRRKLRPGPIIATPNTPSFETPSRRSPRTPTNFIFLSDRKSVPTEFKHLEEKTIKRRREFVARMHNMDCHTAKLLSQYAHEHMDLDLATSDTFERTIVQPLLNSMDRFSLDRESSRVRTVGTRPLERRLDTMEVEMTKHICVTMGDARIEKLDRFYDDLQREIMPEIHIEINKSNKIEGGILQQFEEVAKVIHTNFHSEVAECRAEIEVLGARLENTPKRLQRVEQTLSQITKLREKVREERAKRIAADEAIYDEIVRRTSAMKRAMIAMASDGDSTTVSSGSR